MAINTSTLIKLTFLKNLQACLRDENTIDNAISDTRLIELIRDDNKTTDARFRDLTKEFMNQAIGLKEDSDGKISIKKGNDLGKYLDLEKNEGIQELCFFKGKLKSIILLYNIPPWWSFRSRFLFASVFMHAKSMTFDTMKFREERDPEEQQDLSNSIRLYINETASSLLENDGKQEVFWFDHEKIAATKVLEKKLADKIAKQETELKNQAIAEFIEFINSNPQDYQNFPKQNEHLKEYIQDFFHILPNTIEVLSDNRKRKELFKSIARAMDSFNISKSYSREEHAAALENFLEVDSSKYVKEKGHFLADKICEKLKISSLKKLKNITIHPILSTRWLPTTTTFTESEKISTLTAALITGFSQGKIFKTHLKKNERNIFPNAIILGAFNAAVKIIHENPHLSEEELAECGQQLGKNLSDELYQAMHEEIQKPAIINQLNKAQIKKGITEKIVKNFFSVQLALNNKDKNKPNSSLKWFAVLAALFSGGLIALALIPTGFLSALILKNTLLFAFKIAIPLIVTLSVALLLLGTIYSGLKAPYKKGLLSAEIVLLTLAALATAVLATLFASFTQMIAEVIVIPLAMSVWLSSLIYGGYRLYHTFSDRPIFRTFCLLGLSLVGVGSVAAVSLFISGVVPIALEAAPLFGLIAKIVLCVAIVGITITLMDLANKGQQINAPLNVNAQENQESQAADLPLGLFQTSHHSLHAPLLGNSEKHAQAAKLKRKIRIRPYQSLDLIREEDEDPSISNNPDACDDEVEIANQEDPPKQSTYATSSLQPLTHDLHSILPSNESNTDDDGEEKKDDPSTHLHHDDDPIPDSKERSDHSHRASNITSPLGSNSGVKLPPSSLAPSPSYTVE